MFERPVELNDIEGPNLIPIEHRDETGSVTKVELDWNVLAPAQGFDKFVGDNGEVTIRRRMTLERAQEWINILSGQLERARACQRRREIQDRVDTSQESTDTI